MINRKIQISSPLVRTPQSDDLILWLPGQGTRNKGSLVCDCSNKNNNMTRSGASWTSSPCGHNVLSFDGVDAVSYTHLTLPTNREV